MSVSNPRTRLISFRVSEHDYARLRILSSAQGAQSLADFVRACVCWVADKAPNGTGPLMEGADSRSSFSEFRCKEVQIASMPDQTLVPFEALPGLLLALQWKAESLDQELRRLIAMVQATEPSSRRAGIPTI